MKCRPGCAACCVAISISSPLPLHPDGKPAGVVCRHLDRSTLLCTIWETPEYPQVCRDFKADERYCGKSPAEAYIRLAKLEKETSPG